MMKNCKKLLSLILSLSFVASPNLSLRTFADDDYCAKNSKGGYVHWECASDELLKVGLRKTEDFVNVENLGINGDKEIYAFNFRALDDLVEKKKTISIDALDKEYDTLNLACNTPFLTLNRALTIVFTSLLGAIGGYFLPNTRYYKVSPQNSRSSSSQNSDTSSSNSRENTPPPGYSFNEGLTPKYNLFSSFIGALISGIVSVVGLYNKYSADRNNVRQKREDLRHRIVEINNANNHKAFILNSLLFYLDRPQYITFDMVCVLAAPNDFHFEPKKAGINYTEEELASFPAKFKEIAAKIRKNLKENGLLDLDIAPEPEKQPELPPLTD